MPNIPQFTQRALFTALISAGVAFGGNAAYALPTVVSSGDNDGEGSLRAALENGSTEIVITSEEDIMITETLTYSGTGTVVIYGAGQTVKAMEDFTLLEMSNGASLSIIGVNFEGPGGFDIENQSEDSDMAGKGIFIDVRDDQEGTVRLSLGDVSVSGVANHGIHVSDCDLADDCGSGGGGAGGGSAASIVVSFDDVTISDVGNGKFDADGLRVDERGDGSIGFFADDSVFTEVGADGVELDEGQAGGVLTVVTKSSFNNNGGYCDPELLEGQLEDFLDGAPDEAEFDESEEVSEDDIPGDVSGTSDDRCFEREVDLYDSGFVEAYEYGIDVDDGFDIDEAGEGLIKAVLVGSQIENNLDEGVDFDEENGGDINMIAIDTTARGNADDGYKLSEEGAAGVDSMLYLVESTDNGGKGAVFEEADNGNLNVLVDQTLTDNNDDSDNTGIEVVQEDAGEGLLTVRNSEINDGIDADGVEVNEE